MDYESEEESSENGSSNNNYIEVFYLYDNMKATMILITKTLDGIKQFQEVERYLQEGVMKVIEIIVKWTNKGETAAIIDFDRNITREDFDNINKQLYKPRVIGIKVKKMQIFFTVQIQKTVFELVQKEIKFLEENKMSIIKKVTRIEYIRRVGFITGTHLKIVLADWYCELFG